MSHSDVSLVISLEACTCRGNVVGHPVHGGVAHALQRDGGVCVMALLRVGVCVCVCIVCSLLEGTYRLPQSLNSFSECVR